MIPVRSIWEKWSAYADKVLEYEVYGTVVNMTTMDVGQNLVLYRQKGRPSSEIYCMDHAQFNREFTMKESF